MANSSVKKIERLTNLVIGLLSTRRFVSAETIRSGFPGYEECATADAFNRMFERDKAELREIGIPVVTGTTSAWSEDVGYRIERAAYELPPISLTQDESSAVAVAAGMWRTPSMSSTTAQALVKLRAAGIDVDDADLSTVVGTEQSSSHAESALAVLMSAVSTGTAVRFPHFAAGRGTTTDRTVEPWAVMSSRGRWYLVGFDRDRQDRRTYRLSRITGPVRTVGKEGSVTVPEDVDTRAIVEAAAAEPVSVGSLTVWVQDGGAHELHRAGTAVRAAELAGRAGTVISMPVGSRAATVRRIAGHGAQAVVLEPEDLRREVMDALRGAEAAHPLETATAHEHRDAPQEGRR